MNSLQLLRISNGLILLGLSVRDMLDANLPCQLMPWSSIFDRIRADLDDPCGLKRNSQSFREPRAKSLPRDAAQVLVLCSPPRPPNTHVNAVNRFDISVLIV
jgi:hypothetical protein